MAGILLIPVVVSLAFPPHHGLRFLREEITIRLDDTAATVVGRYVFANETPDTAASMIHFPVVVRDGQSAPTEWRVEDELAHSDVPASRSPDGVSFAAAVGPHGSRIYRITYRQQLTACRFEYMLTTTRTWGAPLEEAVFRIRRPVALGGIASSYVRNSATREGADSVWTIVRRNFLPETNLVLTWLRRSR